MSKSKRRVPKQERSKQRYNHILDTASTLFAAHGIDAVSTNHIAAEANISIGSLYQFFPNKEAIVEALIECFLDDLAAVFPSEIDTTLPRIDLTREILRDFMRFEKEKDGFNEILLNADNTMAQVMNERLAEGVAYVLKQYYPDVAEEKIILCSEVTIQITKGLMMIEHLPPDVLLEQMVIAVASYQSSILEN